MTWLGDSDLPLDLLCRLGDEEAHGVGGDLGAPGVDRDLGVSSVIRPHLCVGDTLLHNPECEDTRLQSQKQQLELDKAELRGLSKGHPREGGGEGLRVHLAASS